ncbi:hypothetical protein R3P38DRAFT_2910694 [Favolaschia claudopus]|uniref:DUF6534 domain-containing protein n=1 Tax=Favolaschia claudopus TaxID=2862362 RepID=A0AAW0CB66_9AGAR
MQLFRAPPQVAPTDMLSATRITMNTSPSLDTFNPGSTIGCVFMVHYASQSRRSVLLNVGSRANELGYAACNAHTLYTYTIVDYGHPERLLAGAVPRSLSASLLFGVIIIVSVQVFFEIRIYTLYKRLYLPILCGTASLATLIVGLVLVVDALLGASIQSYISTKKWLLTTFWALCAVNDLIITAALLFFLIKRRSEVQERTKALLDKLITWAIGHSIHFPLMVNPNNFVWVAISVIEPRLYTMSLVASLNSRTSLRAMNQATTSLQFSTWTNRIELPSNNEIRLTGLSDPAAEGLQTAGPMPAEKMKYSATTSR